MTFRQFAKMFGPRILDSAARRWPGQLCAVYALGLHDPLGRMVATTLHALGLAPNPFDKVPPGAREPVVAGAVRAVDLTDLLKRLIQADQIFSLEGETPLVADADRLWHTLEDLSEKQVTAFLVVAAGIHEVVPVVEEHDLVSRGLFGHPPILGRT